LRPVSADLGFDHHEVLPVARGAEAEFEKPLPRQSFHQDVDFPGKRAPAREGSERQAGGEISRALQRGRAELSEIDRTGAEEGGDASIRLHL
jgi:hypothetical protein